MSKIVLSVAFCFFAAGMSRALELPSRDTPLWNGTAYNDAVPSTGADKLHALGITGKGLTTAILDGGFDLGHAVFDNVNIVNRDSVAAPDPDSFYHGTHVAGVALSMAPDSNLWLEEYSPGLKDAVISEQFRDVLDDAGRYGIAAVNASWGDALEGGYAGPEDVAAVKPLTAEAVRELLAAGVAVVGAAGNAAMNDRMSFPDGLPGVVSVGALSPYGQTASLGTLYGKQGLFLLAPGVNIHTGYGAGQLGTSVAAPHVTGAITLLKSGARAASAEEITAALYDSAARVVYDPDARIDYYTNLDTIDPYFARDSLEKLTKNADLTPYVEWLQNIEAKFLDNDVAAAEWRILNRIAAVAYAVAGNDEENYNAPDSAATFPDTSGDGGAGGDTFYGAALFAKIMETAGGFDPVTGTFAPLEHTEYGFIQVDAAYRLLTSRRAALMAAAASGAGSAHAEALAGFSGALGAVLDQNLADLFQRLDGQPADVLARAARQLGPGWAASTLQSSLFGQLGLHAATERRLARLRESGRDCADGRDVWAESFGGYHEREETRDGGGYHSSFAGVAVGMEKNRGETLFGGFASWANHGIRGDGSAKGGWGLFGLYGGLLRDGFSAGLSLSAGIGGYSLERGADGPAASLVGMHYGGIRVGADSSPAAASFSARGTAEWALFERNGWEFRPGAEAAFAHAFMSGFTEEGGGGINLSVRRHGESYAEGGAGLRVSKTFFRDALPFLTASVKASGLYGAGFGGKMRARFAAGGPSFSVAPEKTRSAWFVPEAALSWRATERMTVSASFRGRFGRHVTAAAGSLTFGMDW